MSIDGGLVIVRWGVKGEVITDSAKKSTKVISVIVSVVRTKR